MNRPLLERYRSLYHEELYQNVLPFWLRHSLDSEHGGYFNCLDRDGKVYDTKKHVWLQGRQVWMMSRIHNHLHGPGKDSEYLQAAHLGARFLRSKARTEGNRVFFSLTREGNPHFLQRKMFAECFYVMAMAEYARATGDASARAEAEEVFEAVQQFARNPRLLGKPDYSKGLPASELAVPMILLNLIDELNGPDGTGWAELSRWCVERIDLHYKPELRLVLETVGGDGTLINSPEGRLINPGHAIEAGWFLMNYGRKVGNQALIDKSLNMIDWSYDYGWDKQWGGIYYFLDREGYAPTQLEWNMKLWWPHCESLVAFIMAYEQTGREEYLRKFEQVHDYSWPRFRDPLFGEWYGYLDRRGEVTHRFKGGPYKGCFHVPRSLFLVEQTLNRLLAKG
jgi:N-acylglucosamine 2-epimerase